MNKDVPPDGGGNILVPRFEESSRGESVREKRKIQDDPGTNIQKRDFNMPPSASVQHTYTVPEFAPGIKLTYGSGDKGPFNVFVTKADDPSPGSPFRILKFAQLMHKYSINGVTKGGIQANGRSRVSVQFVSAEAANAFLVEGDDAGRVGPNSGIQLNWRAMMMADERHPTSDYSNITTYFITFYDEDHNRYLNTTNGTEPFQSFILPWWRQVMWIAMFAGMVIVATVGNLVVIWIVLANKRMRSVTHYFLVNLSVADAMVSTLNVIFNFIYMLNSHWPFGEFYCKFCQFIAVLSISASVFTLMAISIDRYVAIISPLRPRLGKRATLGIAAAIWAGSSLISSPNLVYFTTDTANLPDGSQRIVCFAKWPDYGIAEVSLYDYYYNVVYMALTYFVPIISMMYTYARVGIELWGSKSIGECTQAQLESVKSKRRVVKMMIVVVVIFAVCWLPFHIYFVVTAYYPELTNQPYIQDLYLAIYWLAMSNSMYNPMIYCWMNSKFRRGFKQFFRCCRTLGTSGLRRNRAFGTDRLERSGRSLSPSRKNGTSTIRISMHSTYNNTMVMST